ncbi:MAG: hypothetical protein LUH19_09195 [Lachnospiraceae bacterium]|nr:hypothetical protein [Lachnospiraceae bacterium]
MANKEYHRKNIVARIYDINEGLTHIEQVDFIRIKSDKYNLLIMEDYMPTLGELNGDLTIQAQGQVTSWENIRGFYIHKDNLFRLMIREDRSQEEMA